MKKRGWLRLALAATVLVTGCSGFWDAPTTTTGTGTGGNSSASGAFYVLNQKTAQLAGFAFASGSTTPAAVSGSPQSLGATPFAMAMAPSGEYLYVSTAAGIYLYTIGSGGALSLGNSGQVLSADPAFSMVVDPTGQWIVEAVSGTGTVNAIPIVPSTGLLNNSFSESTASLPTTNVQQVAISPANSTSPYVFVAMGSGGTAVLPFNAANSAPFGTAATIATKSTTGGANTVAVDTTNRLLYVGETVAVSGKQTGGLRVFTIGSSKITELSGSPYASAGTGPAAIWPTANFVYVANKAVSGSSTGNITGFAINSSGGVYSLTKVNTIASGIGTNGLAEDSTGTYLLAVNNGGTPDLNVYTFDSTTAGQLDASTTAATGTDPVQALAIVAVPGS